MNWNDAAEDLLHQVLGQTPYPVREQTEANLRGVAEAMAEGVRQRAETDFGLAITGVAGPGGGTEEKPVGTVFIALADENKTEHRRLNLPGDRHLIRWRASQAALDLLRRRLL